MGLNALIYFAPVSDQIEPVCHPYFGKEFIQDHLGQPGRWFGSSLQRQGLVNPVERGQFNNCLSLPALKLIRSQGEPVAWQLTFQPGPSLTTLWALSNEDARSKIEGAHSTAVHRALMGLEIFLSHDPDKPRPDAQCDGKLFAAFQSGTDARKVPYLHTDAILINVDYDRLTSRYGTLSNARVLSEARRSESLYANYLRFNRKSGLGHFDSIVCKTIKRAGLHKSPLRLEDNPKHVSNCLSGDDLFLAWQEEGARRGFGPEQAETGKVERLRTPPSFRFAAQRISELASRARGNLSRLASNSSIIAPCCLRSTKRTSPSGWAEFLKRIPPGRRGDS